MRVGMADTAIGLLREAAAAYSDVTFIISADHGGMDRNHVEPLSVNSTIPWVINGPKINQTGLELTTPIRTMDTAATAAYLLGLEFPTEIEGQPVLEAFEEAD